MIENAKENSQRVELKEIKDLSVMDGDASD